MSLNLRQRTVGFYDVILRSSTRKENIQNPDCCNLNDLLAKVDPAKASGLELYSGKQIRSELSDWEYDPASQTYAALINRADGTGSDISIRHLKTRKIRRAGKGPDEAFEFSAHMLISPNADGRSARVLLTVGAGVTMASIENMFKKLSALVFSDPSNEHLREFDDPDGSTDSKGNRKKYKVSYQFKVLAHKGQLLDQALKGGAFEQMELVAHEYQKFDSGGNLEIKSESVLVRAGNPKTTTAATLVNAVRDYLSRSPKHWDKVRIKYSTDNNKSAHATLDVNDLDAAFTKRESINFDTDVESQQDKLSPVVMAELLKLPR